MLYLHWISFVCIHVSVPRSDSNMCCAHNASIEEEFSTSSKSASRPAGKIEFQCQSENKTSGVRWQLIESRPVKKDRTNLEIINLSPNHSELSVCLCWIIMQVGSRLRLDCFCVCEEVTGNVYSIGRQSGRNLF